MNHVRIDNTVVNLLWTGGWDSTYQLLQLLLIYKVKVTPFYLIDENRSSSLKEIEAMKRIKNHLFQEYPHVKKLMKATQYFAVADIAPDKNITDSYRSIILKSKIGIQYEWLARFCLEKGIKNMQLSVEGTIHPASTNFFIIQIGQNLIPIGTGNQENFILDQKLENSDVYKVFKYFSFPLIKMNKIQMKESVSDLGWGKIMEMTWFCHNPIRNDIPCGLCGPCINNIKQSFGWRIPAQRRAVSYCYRNLFWPFRLSVKSKLIRMGLFSVQEKIDNA